MLEKRALYISVGLLLLAILCSYSFAQDELKSLDLDLFLEQQSAPPATPVQPVLVPAPSNMPLDSIPKGFGAQLMKNQPPTPPPEPPPAPTPVAQSVSSSSVVVVSSSSIIIPPLYSHYEDYLDSLVSIARSLIPIKEKFESQKALVNAEILKPKTEYESQQNFDARAASFDKEKQNKIKKIDKEYKAEVDKRIGKLKSAVNYRDLQPEWGGILRPDTTREGYQDREEKLTTKISVMERRTTQVYEILAGLDILSKGNLETLDEKNRIYMARLGRAKELMQDYILQDNARVLRTEKKRVSMYLGEYHVDKQEFEFVMNDANSATVPFDYIGKVKISTQIAQEIDRQTDDFTVSLDYINYPFFVGDVKLFPGAKKAYVYYKDQETPNTGVFRNVPGFEVAQGYVEWALHADSIISGKLKNRNLDSLYAMKKSLPKVGTFWSRNKNIIRGTLIGLAAVSTGLAIYENNVAGEKKDKIDDILIKAANVFETGNKEDYNEFRENNKKDYNDSKDALHSAENMRNSFYITAGVFGAAGIVCFFF